MPSSPSLSGIGVVVEVVGYIVTALAAYLARGLRLPPSRRWHAQYTATVATLGLIGFGIFVQLFAPGGLRPFIALAYYMPSWFRVIIGLFIMGNLVMLVTELRRLAKARTQRATSAGNATRGYNWPYGSDNLPV